MEVPSSGVPIVLVLTSSTAKLPIDHCTVPHTPNRPQTLCVASIRASKQFSTTLMTIGLIFMCAKTKEHSCGWPCSCCAQALASQTYASTICLGEQICPNVSHLRENSIALTKKTPSRARGLSVLVGERVLIRRLPSGCGIVLRNNRRFGQLQAPYQARGVCQNQL
jgi:hypothetical protein